MSKFDQILSDDELDALVVEYGSNRVPPARNLLKAIEQAVLAKLAEQEPVAWINAKKLETMRKDKRFNRVLWQTVLRVDKVEDNEIPLYAHPMPCVSPTSDKTACVSEKAESETQAPAAWLHEETGDVISSELKDYAPEMLKGYDTPLYRCPDFSCKEKLDRSSHIPDGWQLVPKEPTTEMLDAGVRAFLTGTGAYKAILAAAPKYTGESK